jgi:RNA polymerase sigma-70 factor (ECF subfamily)
MRLNRLPLRRVSDAQLIARAGDDPVGFSELYTRHAVETVRVDRIETRARERLGLPLDLATEDGLTEVEDRLSPRLLLNGQLETLPVGELDALRLRVIEELSYDEVAERLDIRPTAARLRVSRALRRLAHTTPEENT